MSVHGDGARCRQDVPGVERCIEGDVGLVNRASEFFEDLGTSFRGYSYVWIDGGVTPA